MTTINLFDLYAKITLDDSEYKKKLGEASETTSGFASKFGDGLKKAAAVGAKAVTAASAVAASGVVALAKSAIDNYADYEQLVGGVETLFKNNSDTVKNYADNAYKTAGMSANQYMETVTGFSASLLQSLDGDTAAAAKKADQAITDMSDNANKMGSDITSIQNAYQGFAKQNYTMLDNLKLGYGGTKEEMQRLLDDAEKLSGVKYDISSYSDVVDAIHVVQVEMGIAGTTAAEANSTISGSLSSMKSAWSNLITGIADGSQDFDTLLDNFVSSVSTFGSNILPRVSEVLGGVINLVTGLAPQIIAVIPSLVEQILPQAISGIDSIVAALVGVLPGLVTTVATVISEQAPLLIQSGLDLLLMLGQSLIDNTPTLVDTVISVVNSIATWIVEYADILLETGITIITTLATALTNNLPTLIPVIVEAITLLVTTLTSPEQLSNLIDAAIAVIGALVEGLLNALPTLIKQAPVIISNLVTAIIQNVPKLLQAATKIIGQLATGIVNLLPKIREAAVQIVNKIVTGISELMTKVRNAGTQVANAVLNSIKNKMSEFKQAGRNLLEGIWNGITDKVTWLKGKVSGVVDKIKGWFTSKDGFDTHSPSKWSEGLFKNVMAGASEGLEDGTPGLMRNVTGIVNKVKDGFDFGTASVGFDSSAMGRSNSAMTSNLAEKLSLFGEGATIVVQSVLDGRVIGETAYRYSKDMMMAYGG